MTKSDDTMCMATARRRGLVFMLVGVLNEIDTRLAEISVELRRVQPLRQGSLLLAQYNCGRDCTGCPHPKWLVRTRSMGSGVQGRRVTNPLRCIRRVGEFGTHTHTVRALVAEAETLTKRRAAILNKLGDARRLATWITSGTHIH